jgi:hypothetical protein
VWFLNRKRPIYRVGRTEHEYTDELRIGPSEVLGKAMIEQDAGFLKEGVRVLSQALIEMEVEEHLSTGRHERAPGRTSRNPHPIGRSPYPLN